MLILTLTPSFAASQPSLLMLGDSLTQGYGLLEQDGLVPQLRDWLNKNDIQTRVVNAGVSGDTTAGGLERFEWSLTPDIGAVVVALGSNDMLRGIDPDTTRDNLDGILKIAQSHNLRIMVVGVLAPLNYGPEYKNTFDAVFPDLAQKYSALYVESFFTPFLSENSDISAMKDKMQSDGMHPNELGVAQIVSYIGPKVAQLIAEIPARDK